MSDQSGLPDRRFWTGRDVLVTGHTGFKGSWVVHWLSRVGARVHGLALDPPTKPSLFESASTSHLLASDTRADIRDATAVRRVMESSGASVVLHMAAQPLVRDGYRRPTETFSTNVTGTTNLLEAIRNSMTVEAAVIITTDKVYRPRGSMLRERDVPHVEDDELGAEDPYAWSKVMGELAVIAFRQLPPIDGIPGWSAPIATARAGNVVGGGDWSSERLVPDCVRAFLEARPVVLRYPSAIRPWQHVLDPLNGYLLLAESLARGESLEDESLGAVAFNFGPGRESEWTVGRVAETMMEYWAGPATVTEAPALATPHENPVLRLDSSRARRLLGWVPRWDLPTALSRTCDWYRRAADGENPAELITEQLTDYSR
ncbi:MAG: hypothetical protein RLZZ163_1421 [Actinomycetota bacterium]|jgi:CDP-glucose 4,6-dehydratase